MASKATIVFIVYFIQGTLGLAVPQSPIVGVGGGYTVSIQDVPFMASVHIGGYFCGGSIIHQQFVLTAAHCVNTVANSSDYVRVGSKKRNDGGHKYSIAKYIPHEQYYEGDAKRRNYDIGLLKLSELLTFSASVAPIKLVSLNPIYPGMTALITGWGRIESGERTEKLHEVLVTVAPLLECSRYYNSKWLNYKNICSFDYGAGACSGDSGGPLVYRGRQIGVYSAGGKHIDNCGFYPNIYVNVTAHIGWIRRYIS